MPRRPDIATIEVRLSPQLKQGLKESATFAGHRVRFRGDADSGPLPEEEQDELRTLDRNARGTPKDWKEAARHRGAFQDWFVAAQEAGVSPMSRVVGYLERNCPWHFVEWKEFNAPLLPEGLEPERLPGAS